MTISEATTVQPSPPAGEPRAQPRRARVGRWALGLAIWAAVLVLAGLNAWWAWEAQQLAELATIDRWIAANDYDRAARELRAHVRRSPHNGEARILLSRVLTARNDLRGSADQLHAVPFWWPGKPKALYMEGQTELALGRAKAAEAAWRVCAANDPLHPTPPKVFMDSVTGLVELYNVEDRRQEARDLLWWAYRQTDASSHGQILIMLVWIELLNNDPFESAPKLRRYVETTPDDWKARRALARTEMGMGNAPEATRQLQACLKARPGDVDTWRDWLAILARQGDLDGLQAAIEQLPPGAENDAEIWKFQGMSRQQAGDWPGASAAYRKAIALQPADQDSHYDLSIIEEHLGHHAEAAALRKRSNELRAAREALRKAYDDYLDTVPHPERAPGALGGIMARLAASCETLGWAPLAQAWRRLLPRP